MKIRALTLAASMLAAAPAVASAQNVGGIPVNTGNPFRLPDSVAPPPVVDHDTRNEAKTDPPARNYSSDPSVTGGDLASTGKVFCRHSATADPACDLLERVITAPPSKEHRYIVVVGNLPLASPDGQLARSPTAKRQ